MRKGTGKRQIARIGRMGCVVLFAAMMHLAPQPAFSAGPTVQPTAPDCTYTEQKSPDGKTQFVLNGAGCPNLVAKVKQQASQAKVYGGGDCEGPCVCTWEDRCGQRGCFICRGCCREILTKQTSR